MAGAAAAALILFLSMRRGRAAATAHLDVWSRALAACSLWERLTQYVPGVVSLILALSALLVGLAGSRPFYRYEGAREYYVAVDRSVTMGAIEPDGRTRLAHALDRIDAIRRPADRMGIISIGSTLQILGMPGEDQDRALAAIAEPGVEPVAAEAGRALRALQQFETPVFLFTDGAGEKSDAVRAWLESTPGCGVFAVGTDAANMGIVDLSVEDSFPEPEFMMETVLKGTGPRTLEISEGERVILREAVAADAEGGVTIRRALPRGAGGLFILRITPGDSFAIDDTAGFHVLPPASAPLVVIAGAAGAVHPVLDAAARTLARNLQIEAMVAKNPADAPEGAVILQNGGDATAVTRGVVFGAPLVAGLARGSGSPSPMFHLDRGHAQTQGLVFDGLVAAPDTTPPPGAVILASGAHDPWIGLYTNGPREIVFTTFALENSNITVLGGDLAVFLRRAYTRCAGPRERGAAFLRTRDVRAGGMPVKPGPARLPGGGETWVSLLDRRGSDIRPGVLPGEPRIPPGPMLEQDYSSTVAACALTAAVMAALALGFLMRPIGSARPVD